MRSRTALIACCLLVPAETAFAQLAGRWGADGGTFLDLKQAGRGTVSGIVYFKQGRYEDTAAVNTGTYDVTSGAFKLQGTARRPDGSAMPYVIEGKVARDSVSGFVGEGANQHNFAFVRLDNAPNQGDANAELRKRFGQVSAWVSRAADMVPADKYSYRPTQSVRTFGEQIAHLADSYAYYCAQGAGRNVEWSDANEKGKTDKATLVPKLRETLATCTPAYATPKNIGALIENVGHTNLHYGNIITYMRMLGLTPPSS